MVRPLFMSLSLLVAATVLTNTARCQSVGARSLAGAWNTHVSAVNPPPNVEPEFDTLILFSEDGTAVENNGEPGLSAGFGVWAYAGSQKFDVTWLKHVRNPANGKLEVIVKVRTKITMNSPNEYAGAGVTEVYAPDGHLIVSYETNTSGKRIELDPLP